MNDPALNNLLQWGIKHADPAALKEAASAPPKPMSASDREALLSIMQQVQGTSDADRMLESMVVIEHPESTQEAKLTAFENFEMMIQNIDNANNMEQIPSKKDANNKEQKKLWTRLVELLEAQDAELRMWAAFCCSTAVQNNIRAQERLLVLGAIPTLVRMATTDTDRDARKKAISALSSAVRNFQPGLDEAVSHTPAEYKPQEKLDAHDMGSVDVLINKLRENV